MVGNKRRCAPAHSPPLWRTALALCFNHNLAFYLTQGFAVPLHLVISDSNRRVEWAVVGTCDHSSKKRAYNDAKAEVPCWYASAMRSLPEARGSTHAPGGTLLVHSRYCLFRHAQTAAYAWVVRDLPRACEGRRGWRLRSHGLE
jgi:hypothetical protein